VKVQGEGSAQEIAKAIQEFNKYDLCDVMIVGRGGGSIEDLWAFNEEVVADAIFHSRIPIISAVGHETDHCIADYVADVRAPTPSAAAEIVIAEKAHQLQFLEQTRKRMQQTLFQLIRHDKQRLQAIVKSPYMTTSYGILGPWMQRLDELKCDIEQSMKQRIAGYQVVLKGKEQLLLSLRPGARLENYRQKLNGFAQQIDQSLTIRCGRLKEKIVQNSRQLDRSMLQQIKNHQQRLDHMQNILDKVNPKTLLGKGYCILFSEKRKSIITSVHNVAKNDDIKVLISDGTINAIVKEVTPT
jgi:exodeoxyribonuclease VII large subunit